MLVGLLELFNLSLGEESLQLGRVFFNISSSHSFHFNANDDKGYDLESYKAHSYVKENRFVWIPTHKREIENLGENDSSDLYTYNSSTHSGLSF